MFSLVAAGILPFAGAALVAHAQVVADSRAATRAQLDASVRGAWAVIDGSVADARDRARALGSDPRVQRALLAGDRTRMRALGGAGTTIAADPATRVARPAVRAIVRAGGRPIGVVIVRLPAARTLLERAQQAVAPGTGLALVRGNEVLARIGPAANGTTDGMSTAVRPVDGFDGVRLAVSVDGETGGSAITGLRLRLALAAALSVLAIALLAFSLARPLLGSLQEVETAAREADVDALTSLANRRLFDRTLQHELVRSQRTGRPCSLLLLDLDDFKLLNDRYGHEAGDAALRTVSSLLRSHIRTIDLAARIGGEEFAVLLPETAAPQALVVAERLLGAIRRAEIATPHGEVLRTTASLGIADTRAGRSAPAILREADRALYAAKRAGKDRVMTSSQSTVNAA